MSNNEPAISDPEPLPDGLRVRVLGEIDFSRSADLRAALMELIIKQKPARLVLDLSDVMYMDSSGVATLIEAFQLQNKAKHKLVLYGLQPKVQGIFEIARLDTVFKIALNAEQATTI